MQQVVDLQGDEGFSSTGIALLSIAMDPPADWRRSGNELGIELPMLSDEGNRVATEYGIMRWAMAGVEPGHTFVLVDADGRIAWVRDYGAPEHGGSMYVAPQEVLDQVSTALGSGSA
ncbi:MAG: redoxin domain-containing protein [Actinobacteria bacterium]|nr:redoxin domain-containing protein [Actinomycetota bacterium]